MSVVLLYLFIGVLLSQLVYVAANWWQYKRTDYVYYFFYLFVLLLYFMIIHQPDFLSIPYWPKAETNLLFLLRPFAFGIYALYFSFVISFLDTAVNFPKFHHMVKLTRNLLLLFAMVFLVINLIDPVANWDSALYLVLSLLIFVSVVWLIVALWRNPTPLSKYILRGALAAAIGAFIGNMMMVLHFTGVIAFPENYILYVAAGVVVELFYFNSGLTYKSRQIELNMIQSQQQLITELERSRALAFSLSNIRQKISRDLHDDVGATLSGIAMYSYITKAQISNQENEAVSHSLDMIKDNANQMVEKLNDIVWAVNPIQDHLASLLERLKEFALQIVAVKGIALEFSIPEFLAGVKLPMDKRKNIYLICKEAINNAVKYSNCQVLTITVNQTNDQVCLNINDDGAGFMVEQVSKGNGLVNMMERAKEIEAVLVIDSVTASGTKISLTCKIT